MRWRNFLPPRVISSKAPGSPPTGCKGGHMEVSELESFLCRLGARLPDPGGRRLPDRFGEAVGSWGRNTQASQMARSPTGCRSALKTTDYYWIVGGRGAPIPTPGYMTTPETGFLKTCLPVHSRGGPGHHSSKALLPSKPQALGCPDQGTQPGKCGTKGRWRGSVGSEDQGWCTVKSHDAGELGAASPGGKGHWTDLELG